MEHLKMRMNNQFPLDQSEMPTPGLNVDVSENGKININFNQQMMKMFDNK